MGHSCTPSGGDSCKLCWRAHCTPECTGMIGCTSSSRLLQSDCLWQLNSVSHDNRVLISMP